MQKIYPLVLLILAVTTAKAQNVGIGTNTPQTKLDINGALSARITSVAATASVTIPDNVTLFRLTNTAGGSSTALTLSNPKDGQFLTVINEDDNAATLNGFTVPAGTPTNPSLANFINIGGVAAGWKPSGDNSTGANAFTAGTGLSWSGTTLNSVWSASGSDIYNNNSGNFGIGNSAPGGLLDVSTTAPTNNNNGKPVIVIAQSGGTGGAATNGGNVTLNSGEGANGGTAGTVNINSSNSTTGAVNIANGTSTQTVNVATGAGNKTVNIGSTNSGSTTNINAGTGGVSVSTLTTGGLVQSSVTGKLTNATATDITNAANGSFILNQTATPQTGAGFNTAGSGTVGTNLTVNGNNINGSSTGDANLNLNSTGGVRANLDTDNDGSESFGVKDGSNNLVFQVDENGDVTNTRHQTMSGNITMTGTAATIQANTTLNASSNGGTDVIIDADNNSTNTELVVKKDGSSTRLFRVNEDGNTRIHNPNSPSAGGNLTVDGLSGSGTRIVTVNSTGDLSAGTTLGSVVPTSTTLTINPTTNQTTVSPSGAQDLSANRTWTVGTVQDIATTSSPTFTNETLTGTLNANGGEIQSTTLLNVRSNTDVRVRLDNDANGSNQFEITPNGTATPSFVVTEAGNVTANGYVRMLESGSSPTLYTGIQSGDLTGSSLTFTLPTGYGNSGEVIKGDGTGNLSWTSVSSLNADLTDGNGITGGVYDGSVARTYAVQSNNGLTTDATDDAVELGGTLNKTTTIANAGFNLGVTGTGNVGIGTASPGSKLEVKDGNIKLNATISPFSGGIYNTNSVYLADNQFLDFSDGTYKAASTGTSNRLQLDYNNGFRFINSPSVATNTAVTSNEVMRINTSGNVGIGATTVGARLHVGGSNQAFRIDYDGSNNYFGSMRWAGLQLGNNGVNRIVAGRTAAGGSLNIYVNNTNDGADYSVTPDGTLAMTFANNGSVTINNGALDMNSHKITNLTTPTASTDAANKSYVDAALTGLGSGSGSLNKLARWTSTTALGTGTTYDDGTNVSIGTGVAASAGRLEVVGSGLTTLLRNTVNTSYAGMRVYNDQNSNVRALEIDYSGSAYAGSLQSGGITGEAASIATTGNFPMMLGTSNTARLTILGGGNIGIGTIAPLTKLQLNTKVGDDNSFSYDANAAYFVHQTPTATATLNDPKTILYLARQGTSGQAYGAAAAFNLSRYENAGSSNVGSRTRLDFQLAHENFLTTSTNVMTLLSVGFVGIGTTSPGAKLSFNNMNDGSNGADGITWYNPSPTAYGIYRSAGSWSSPDYQQLTLAWSTGIVIDGGSSYGRSGTVLQPGAGNVGIGITAPTVKLDIQGASGVRIGYSSYEANLVFGNTSSWKSGIRVYDNGVAEMRIWHVNSSGKIVLSTGYNGDGATTMPTDGLIVSANQVGIGTMSPGSQKLYVNQTGIAGSGYATSTVNAILGYGSCASYSFGVTGYECGGSARGGGVHGAYSAATWGALGYVNSGGSIYGLYYTSTGNGSGYLPTSGAAGIGAGGVGDFMGSWTRGGVIGTVSSGELMASYNHGNEYTSGYQADLVNTGTERVAAYAVTSPELKVYDNGSAILSGSSVFVPFNGAFAGMVDGTPDVTVSAVGTPAQLYIQSIEKNGFYVAFATGGGTAKFSWIAVAKRIDSKNITELPGELKSNGFDEHLKGLMFNEANTEQSAKPMWWDGNKIRFDAIPEEFKKKEDPKPKEENNAPVKK